MVLRGALCSLAKGAAYFPAAGAHTGVWLSHAASFTWVRARGGAPRGQRQAYTAPGPTGIVGDLQEIREKKVGEDFCQFQLADEPACPREKEVRKKKDRARATHQARCMPTWPPRSGF